MIMHQQLNEILEQAHTAIKNADSITSLEGVRVHYLGKKGVLTELLKGIGALSPDQRPEAGQAINDVKEQLVEQLTLRRSILDDLLLKQQLEQQSIDVTLPGRSQSAGSLHPVTRARQRIEVSSARLATKLLTAQKLKMIIIISKL